MHFNNLKFIEIDNIKESENLKNRPYTRALVDIFDGSLWSSKVSLVGNVFLIILIVISSLEVIISSQNAFIHFQYLLLLVYNLTSLFFIVEIGLRISLAGYLKPEFKGLKGKINYLLTFYSIIDVLSITPYLAILFGLPVIGLLKPLKILRIWRLMRYVPTSKTIFNAFRNKKEEIFVSFFLVALLSLTISAFLFFVENGHGKIGFKSIISALTWSIGKYTGDYGGIAHYEPITGLGQLLATLNGLLGIALFALPAGLLGSAFIDELGERRHKNRSTEIAKLIGKRRYGTFDYIQSKLLFSDEEIIKAIRTGKNLRFRAMKSSSTVLFNDVKIIESFNLNTSYGYRIINNPSWVTIINCIGNAERGISHFSRMVVERLGYNYISKELDLITKKGKKIAGFNSIFYSSFEKNINNLPESFKELRSDMLSSINENGWVIVFVSSASGRNVDFHFTYGNGEGALDGQFEGSTISDFKTFEKLYSLACDKSINIPIVKKNKSKDIISFEISQHAAIGSKSKDELGFFLQREKKVNVLTIYININILIGEDDRYDAAVNFLVEVLGESLGK